MADRSKHTGLVISKLQNHKEGTRPIHSTGCVWYLEYSRVRKLHYWSKTELWRTFLNPGYIKCHRNHLPIFSLKNWTRRYKEWLPFTWSSTTSARSGPGTGWKLAPKFSFTILSYQNLLYSQFEIFYWFLYHPLPLFFTCLFKKTGCCNWCPSISPFLMVLTLPL